MPAGYSGTPLAKKLGIKPGTDVVALNSPENYRELLEPLPERVSFEAKLRDGEHPFVHYFTTSKNELEEIFPRLREHLAKSGILWVSWPKKSSGLVTDLTRDVIRGIGLEAGLVDTKICAVDETWSGLKFLYRLIDR